MQKRIHHLSAITVLATVLLSASATHAALVESFTTLRAELVDRALVLTGSVDKVEQKQGKACIKAIATLDKSITLAGNVKAGSKVAKSLKKAFPDEFGLSGLTAVFTNNLQSLIFDGFSSARDQVAAVLDALETSVNALPAGKDKDKAQAGLDAAITSLNAAQTAINIPDFSVAAKALGSSLKSAAKAQKVVDQAGGGGGADTFVADVTIGAGTNDHFVATLLGEPNYTISSGTLDLNGSRGTFVQGDDVTAALCGGFNGAPGTYALGGCGGYFQYGTPSAIYAAVTGTLYIATFNTTIGGGSTNAATSGTFAFTASDGGTTVTVTNGAFDLHNVLVFP